MRSAYWNSETARRDMETKINGLTWSSLNDYDYDINECGYINRNKKVLFKIKKELKGILPIKLLCRYIPNLADAIIFTMIVVK